MSHFLLPLVVAVVAADLPPAQVKLLDGSERSGQIVAWDREGVTIKSPAGEEKLPVDRLLSCEIQKAKPQGDPTPRFIELVDGVRLSVTDFTTSKHEARVTSPQSSSPLEIDLALVRSVELQTSSPAAQAAWQELEKKELAGDVLLVAKKDGAAVDYLAGVLGDVSADSAQFQWEGERMEVKRSRIAAIVYHRQKRKRFDDPVCQLDLLDGSRIPARDIELVDDHVRVTTPAGVELNLDLAAIERVDFSAGKLAYLSDMKPVLAKWTPRIGTAMNSELMTAHAMPRSDQSYSGSALTLAWPDEAQATRRETRIYAKGLAVRSRTELEYRLPEGMQKFAAIAGIDPLVAGQGHVALEVRGDGRLLWQGAIDGRRPPVSLDVDLKGARRLRLIVDYGENLDYGDRLHLVEARVTK